MAGNRLKIRALLVGLVMVVMLGVSALVGCGGVPAANPESAPVLSPTPHPTYTSYPTYTPFPTAVVVLTPQPTSTPEDVGAQGSCVLFEEQFNEVHINDEDGDTVNLYRSLRTRKDWVSLGMGIDVEYHLCLVRKEDAQELAGKSEPGVFTPRGQKAVLRDYGPDHWKVIGHNPTVEILIGYTGRHGDPYNLTVVWVDDVR